jgi:hypothetical protein
VAETLLLELATFIICHFVVNASLTSGVLPQVVLCVGSMFWTQEVAESIRSNALPAYSKKCTDDLLDVSHIPPSHASHICALSLLTAPDTSQLLLGLTLLSPYLRTQLLQTYHSCFAGLPNHCHHVSEDRCCQSTNSSKAHVHVQVVNKVRGKLSKLERKTLSALIVVDVHARDVATELAAQGVSSETDFEWMSQLR